MLIQCFTHYAILVKRCKLRVELTLFFSFCCINCSSKDILFCYEFHDHEPESRAQQRFMLPVKSLLAFVGICLVIISDWLIVSQIVLVNREISDGQVREISDDKSLCCKKTSRTLEFSLNVFTEFAEFSDKNSCHYSKRI